MSSVMAVSLRWLPPLRTGFVVLPVERLARVDPDHPQQVRHLAVQTHTDLGDLGDADAAECGAGLIHREHRVVVGSLYTSTGSGAYNSALGSWRNIVSAITCCRADTRRP